MSTPSRPDLLQRAGQILWFAWLPVILWFTPKILTWHVDRFKIAGPQYYSAALILLPALLVITCGYVWGRRKMLWQFELLALAMVAILALLHYEPRASLVCAVFFLSSYTLGNLVARRFQLSLSGSLDRLIVGFGIGCGLLIPTVFVIGLLHLLYPAVLLILLLIPPVLLYRDSIVCLSDLRSLNASWKNSTELRHPMVGIAIVFSFIAAVCALMTALAPSTTFDALKVHFPSVQYYASAHAIVPIQEIDYSYFPQGAEALWTLAYELAGQPGVQLPSVLFFVLFLIVIFRLARECGADPAGALIGTVWAGTLPFLHSAAGGVMKNDVILAFFQALALYAFSRWLTTRDFRWIVAGAFFVGQSFGMKYIALFGGVPLAILYGYAAWKQPRRWRAAVLAVLVFLVFGTFWAVRSYVLTGNPVYPASTQQAVSGGVMAHGHSLLEKAGRYVQLPWTILFDGGEVSGSPLLNPAGILWVVFFPLALVRMLQRRSTGTVIACVVFLVVYFAYWSTILSNLRFAIVPFAVLTMLLGGAVTHFYNRQEYKPARLSRALVLAAEMYCLLIAAIGTMSLEINPPLLKYFAHLLDKPGYLRSVLPAYGSLEYLKGVAEPGAAVLGVNNCSRWYAPNPLRFECQFCPPDCKLEDFTENLAKLRPRYVILPEPEVVRGLLQDLNGGRPATRLYRDAYFSVFQLDKGSVSPGK